MTCPAMEELAALAEGELSVNRAAELEAHVASCTACARARRSVERARVFLSQPASPDPRFVAALMQKLPRDRRTQPLFPWLVTATVAAVALLLWIVPRAPNPEGMVARGGAAHAAALDVTARLHPQGAAQASRSLRDGDALRREDGLSFTVTNPGPAVAFLALFAVDKRGDVHWFYPGRSRPEDDPSSIAVAAGPEPVVLPDGIVPEAPAAGEFVVVALFASAPLLTSRVESVIAQAGVRGLATLSPLATRTLRLVIQAGAQGE